jgi:uncharacterized membrane protein
MTRIYVCVSLVLTVAALVASVVLYQSLPDEIPVHWNIRGEVDAYGAKWWAAFLTPGLMAGMIALLSGLAWLSPKQFEVDSFRSTYYYVLLLLTVFFAYVHGLTLWAGWKGPFDIGRAIIAGVLLMFTLLGNVLGKVRRNFWMGVRTPWTIASERVWNDTHRLAARLFVAAGTLGFLITLLGLPMSVTAISVFGLIMVAALVPVSYSLVLYKRLERRGEV